jgi:hypothetical protein
MRARLRLTCLTAARPPGGLLRERWEGSGLDEVGVGEGVRVRRDDDVMKLVDEVGDEADGCDAEGVYQFA